MRVLIVDDEPSIRQTLRMALEAMGHTVDEAASGSGALRQAERRCCDVALVDMRLGSESGIDLLEKLRQGHPRLAGVVITAHASITTAVEAMRRGAFDYLPKPFTPDQIRAVLERVVSDRRPGVPVSDLEELEEPLASEVESASPDPLVQRVMDQVRLAAPTEAVVLIRGENGTGKGVLARTLHAWSKRAGGPFVTVSCPSLNPELLESDLFGHARGAFTDAFRDVSGKVAAAEGGTLFLDEVGDLPLQLQPKLLRFLQEWRYERVGETASRSANVRVVAATNRDLDATIAAGAFRPDLFYRLNVIELMLPPLRHRSDVGVLADRFLASFSRQTGRKLTGFMTRAREALARYAWPGNVRELRNAVERAVILANGPEVGLEDLPERIALTRLDAANLIEAGERVSLVLLEAEHIRRVLRNTSSLDEAARVLEIDASTLYRKRKRLGL